MLSMAGCITHPASGSVNDAVGVSGEATVEAKAERSAKKVMGKQPRLENGYSLIVGLQAGQFTEFEDREFRLDSEGKGYFPYLGEVIISGLTLEEAQDKLQALYQPYFKDKAHVTLSFKDEEDLALWGFVSVAGKVGEPGIVMLPPTGKISLQLAIQKAGGYEKSAKRGAVEVTHYDEHGTPTVKKIDMERMGGAGSVDGVEMLYAGDKVVVKERVF